MICAQQPGGGIDACQGDSGGGLTTPARVLVGVVSFGIGCGRPSHSGVYARVGSFRNWINSNAV